MELISQSISEQKAAELGSIGMLTSPEFKALSAYKHFVSFTCLRL